MSISWITPAGELFSCSPGDTVDTVVEATSATSYKFLCGTLPDGISLSTSGSISGVIGDITKTSDFMFVVRASAAQEIKDRTFTIKVLYATDGPWVADAFSLVDGVFNKLLINRDYIDLDITLAVEQPVTYSVKAPNRLPFGLHLSSAGKLYGFPKLILAPEETKVFNFTIVASDGTNTFEQPFSLEVIDSDSASIADTQPPEFISNLDLGVILADDKQYISVEAYDPNLLAGPVRYSTTDTLPPNLSLDPNIGYLYGVTAAQTDYSHRYYFTIEATKTDIKTGDTAVGTGTFTITVVNQYYNNVVWPNSQLQNLTEGLISEVTVEATQKDATWPLNYYLVPGSELPSGLTLSTSTGHIIGNATTSGHFTFTIAASTASYIPSQLVGPILPYPVTFNTFNLNISPVSTDYTSIYAQPFLTVSQQQEWNTFINNDSIFLPDIVYRADDPNFGVQTTLKIFLEFGIEVINISQYAEQLYLNLYERRLNLGAVKTAIAKDKLGNHVYDAIYVDVVDNLDGAKQSIEIYGTTYYPGSIDNLRNSLEKITLEDQSTIKVDGKHLPKFMTTVATGQEYGYMKAAVLCYTLPGQSAKILNRIKASKFNFNDISFFIDRLVVQNSLDVAEPTYIVFRKRPVG